MLAGLDETAIERLITVRELDMNKRAEFIETLKFFLDFQRNRTGTAILLFLTGLITLGWFANAVYGWFSLLSKLLIQRWRGDLLVDKRLSSFYSASFDVLIAALIFYLVYRIMKYYLRRNQPIHSALDFETPVPHKGLIFLLSTYKPGTSQFGEYDRIALANKTHARNELLKSNWGPLVIATQHHAQAATLEHCWLVCTAGDKGSAKQFKEAEQVVKAFAGQSVRCYKVGLENLNDLRRVVELVEAIYQQAPGGQDLTPDQIIADFTGGTSAMSGGVILATILEDRKVEYVTQDPDNPVINSKGRAMTPEEIAAANLLITIVTSPALLPVKSAEMKPASVSPK
jgi:hypothetical protein